MPLLENRDLVTEQFPNPATGVFLEFSPTDPKKKTNFFYSDNHKPIFSHITENSVVRIIDSRNPTSAARIVTSIGSDVMTMWTPNYQTQKRISELLGVLSGHDREDFYKDILEASYKAIEENSLRPILETLESWDATAEVLMDEDLSKKLIEAEEEFKRGEGISWYPGME